MTQDSEQRSPSYRRSTRASRNRPVLVTSNENEGSELVVEESMPSLEESLAEVQAQNPSATPQKRRLPGFFSTVGKQEKTETAREIDPTQARMARASRSKATPAKANSDLTSSAPKAETKKAPARSTTAARPASGFKTKYILGMGIYLLGANFLGIFITNIFGKNDSILTQFSLLGGQIVVKTSTLVFLAILVILLVLLARFDLIPRSLGAMSGASTARPASKSGSSASRDGQNSGEGSRTPPLTMRQGVKGENDDLYLKYRAKQRRERKK